MQHKSGRQSRQLEHQQQQSKANKPKQTFVGGAESSAPSGGKNKPNTNPGA